MLLRVDDFATSSHWKVDVKSKSIPYLTKQTPGKLLVRLDAVFRCFAPRFGFCSYVTHVTLPWLVEVAGHRQTFHRYEPRSIYSTKGPDLPSKQRLPYHFRPSTKPP